MFEIFRAVSEKREPTVVRTLELLAGNDDMLKEFILVNRETKGDEGSLREFFKFAAVYAKISGYPQRCVNDLQGLGSAGQEELPSIVSTQAAPWAVSTRRRSSTELRIRIFPWQTCEIIAKTHAFRTAPRQQST